MLKEFLKYVVDELSPVETFVVDDRAYSGRPVSAIKSPVLEPMTFNTLGGFIDFANSLMHLNEWKEHKVAVNIVDEKKVQLVSLEPDEWMQRTIFAVATTAIQPAPFPFGKFIPAEEFAINLRTRFVESQERDELIRFVSGISYSSTIELSDDGVTQTVGQKAGVVLKNRAELPTTVELRPYRTFLEAVQPESTFFVRARKDHNDRPELALFENDGGEWRIEAVNQIKKAIAFKLNSDILILC